MTTLLVLVSLLLAACGGSADVSGLREPGAPPAYWLGEEFEGLPLTADAGTAGKPNLVYGTCDPGPHEGCSPPLQLQHWPLLERSPAMFPDRTSCRVLEGVPVTAAVFATTGGVEVYVGDRVVVLFGSRDLVRKALGELRPLQDQEPRLPPPPAWVRSELERCGR